MSNGPDEEEVGDLLRVQEASGSAVEVSDLPNICG